MMKQFSIAGETDTWKLIIREKSPADTRNKLMSKSSESISLISKIAFIGFNETYQQGVDTIKNQLWYI
jgi:hypothetical protein